MNAKECLENVVKGIEELEAVQGKWNVGKRFKRRGYDAKYTFDIGEVYDEFGIFDWWDDGLSISQLKKMQSFLKTAIKLGFTGYVCFKVGVAGCSHGMWAHVNESTTGYSPDGDCLFHSFRSGDNYYDICWNGEWAEKDMNLAEVKEYMGAQ